MQIVLQPFNEFTNLASEGDPKLASGIGVYHEISELFDSIIRQDNGIINDASIIRAVQAGKRLFDTYNKLVNETPLYFIVLVLDPRMKGAWIENNHPAGKVKLDKVQKLLHK